MLNFLKCNFFFFKQKTAYEIPLCDWSSDVCSSDLLGQAVVDRRERQLPGRERQRPQIGRASCRERVYSGVEISVVAVSLKKKSKRKKSTMIRNNKTTSHIKII